MRPKLHRAAKIRLAVRLAAFCGLLVAFFAAGGVFGALGINPLAAQIALAAGAFAVLVVPVVAPVLRPPRARATMPRTLSSETAA